MKGFIAPRMDRELMRTLFAPGKEYSRRDAWADLYERADYRTGEVRVGRPALALAWGWNESRVERFFAQLVGAGLAELRASGKHARQGRILVILDLSGRTDDRTDTGQIGEQIKTGNDNDLPPKKNRSVNRNRTDRRTPTKYIEPITNLPPTEEGKDGATGSRALVLVGRVVDEDGLTPEQRTVALAMHRKWIEHYSERAGSAPSPETIRAQCKIAKQLAKKYSREDLGRAFVGMDAYWKFKNGEAWTLRQLAADFHEVHGLAVQNRQIKQAMAEAEFDNLTRGVA